MKNEKILCCKMHCAGIMHLNGPKEYADGISINSSNKGTFIPPIWWNICNFTP